MRKVTAFSFILLLLLALPMSVLASSISGPGTVTSQITTTIPDAHKIILDGNNVELSFNGMIGNEVVVPRHSEPSVLLVPAPGYEVAQVLFDGQDITAAYKNGTVTLPKVCGDETLTVVTRKATPVDRVEFSGTVTDSSGKPISGATVTIANPGATDTTDNNGGYTIPNVPIGANTITVTLPDGTVKTVSISIIQGDTLSVTYANGIYTIVLPKGAAGVSLKLAFDVQGNLAIASAGTVWPFFDNPRTGDIIRFFIAMMLLSGTALLGIWLHNRKRQKEET